ncbi:MAG: response regulator, partial [Alphaproteobacteria bacterium]
MAKSILIVDDDPVQRRLLGEIVAGAGFRPISVDGGRSALARLADRGEGDVDLVLLDLQMPDIDGIGVLERIKPDHPGLPVIVITAHAGIDHVVRA